jgi:glycosyltransferase involved in cell wall biosynthesis
MGGAEKLAYEFAIRLDPARFKSYLCTTREAWPPEASIHERDRAELATAGVGLLELNRRSTAQLTPWLKLYSLLRRESIDIVHAHMPRASVPGSILARLARVPVVISHEHGSLLENKRVRVLLDRNVVARLSDLILAVSEYDRRNLIETERIPPDRISVLPNGIAPLVRAGHDFRAELGVPRDVSLIGAVGRLYPQKAYGTLIRAAAILKNRGRAFTCVIVGRGPEEDMLRELIRSFELEQTVLMIGRREDVPEVVAAFDVAVLPSDWEGMPLALIEYMAAGAPIVATAVGGVPELIHDGEQGLLVQPGDPEALADALERMLADPAFARRLGDAARARQQAEYDLDIVVKRLERIFVDLYDRSHGPNSQKAEPAW